MNTALVADGLRGRYTAPPAASIEEEVADEFLKPSSKLSPHWTKLFHPRIGLDVPKLAPHVSKPPIYDPRVRIHFTRKGLNGDIADMQMRSSAMPVPGAMAMTRKMTGKRNAVKGVSGQMPFTPGGLDIKEQSSAAEMHRSSLGLLDMAPGLSRGMKFSGVTKETDVVDEEAEFEDGFEDLDAADRLPESLGQLEITETGLQTSKFNLIDDLLPPTANFVRQLQQNVELQQPTERQWAHMVDINKNMVNFSELVPNPARTWPFELDNFQKEAVYHLEQGDSVFIAAHTSAGKTVVAEYAMSMAAQHMTKCIYTSPIKALSNQKYRDFKEEYDDVGILTGDVQLNPDASTLIMTTEILRSMLYRGADIIRDVEFIIFDEVHYVNDSERGVVWEEVIIMLPDHVKLVLLSATVPNTFEFANWVGRTKQKDVYVISTPKRPVPLKHHLWLKKNLIEVVDEHRQFQATNYNRAQDLLAPKPANASARGGSNVSGNQRGGNNARGGATRGGGNSRGGRGGANSGKAALQRQTGVTPGRFNQSSSSKNDLLELSEFLKSKTLLPAVFFVFSRKMAEQYAQQMSAVQLNNGRERSQVYMFMDKAVSRLRKEDRQLPQIEMLRQLLQQGIGLHHSGLLPIMKEVVEILFAKGLVKLLFATETFAMGLNLPTRTVVFTAVRKFDSKNMRDLSPGEYTQMAGRAGRRGLDSVGTVIIMNNNKDQLIPKTTLEHIALGTPLKLSSQFRLTYNMILSLLRIEALRVEDVIQQSFSENAQFVLRPEREQKLLKISKDLKIKQDKAQQLIQTLKISDENYALFKEFSTQLLHLTQHKEQLNDTLARVLQFTLKNHYCVRRNPKSGNLEAHLILFINTSAGSEPVSFTTLFAGTLRGDCENLPLSVEFVPKLVDSYTVSSPKEMYRSRIPGNQIELFSELVQRDSTKAVLETKQQIASLFTEISTASVKSVSVKQSILEYQQEAASLRPLYEQVVSSAEELGCSKTKKLYSELNEVAVSEALVQKLSNSAELSNTALLPEYEQRINVLRAANYLDENLNVALKGRVACEISTGYELYLTELIMDNFLGSYEPEEIVALLSAFVFDGQRNAEDPPTVTPKLDEGKDRLLELVDYVQRLAIENQVTLTQDEADFATANRFALMQVVYEWARGTTFSEIIKLTTCQEGLIVRVINRLDEICRSVMNAARIIGEVNLYDKLAIAQERIRRDIVFCSSLYL